MQFDVAGPFKLERFTKAQIFTKDTPKCLKATFEDWDSGLANAYGCYVFALKAGQGWKPWYVGQAFKRVIWKEATNSDNLAKYNKCIGDRKGTPYLFALPWCTPSGRYSKKSGADSSPSIDFLEDWLIEQSLMRNDKLINSKRTMLVRKLEVYGLLNAGPGEETKSSRQLKDVLYGPPG